MTELLGKKYGTTRVKDKTIFYLFKTKIISNILGYLWLQKMVGQN
jgi:hypothetical protein